MNDTKLKILLEELFPYQKRLIMVTNDTADVGFVINALQAFHFYLALLTQWIAFSPPWQLLTEK